MTFLQTHKSPKAEQMQGQRHTNPNVGFMHLQQEVSTSFQVCICCSKGQQMNSYYNKLVWTQHEKRFHDSHVVL